MPKSEVKTAIRRKPDAQVSEPTRVKSSSFAAVVSDLGVGEMACRSVPVKASTKLSDIARLTLETRESLRNSTAPSVRQAKERTGGEYTMEIFNTMTPTDRYVVVAIVTRVS